jgi:hypothetical protein
VPRPLKYAVAVLAGLIVAGLLVAGIEAVGHAVYPPPPDFDPTDRESIAAHTQALPPGAFAFVLIAWTVGAFVGGVLAARIAPAHRAVIATVIGAFILAGSVSSLVMIPHPVWFAVAALVLVVAATFAAAAIGGRWDRVAP